VLLCSLCDFLLSSCRAVARTRRAQELRAQFENVDGVLRWEGDCGAERRVPSLRVSSAGTAGGRGGQPGQERAGVVPGAERHCGTCLQSLRSSRSQAPRRAAALLLGPLRPCPLRRAVQAGDWRNATMSSKDSSDYSGSSDTSDICPRTCSKT